MILYPALSNADVDADSCMFYNDLSVYGSFGGVVFSHEEGQRVAKALGPTHKNLILQNHGLLTAGGTVAEAAAFFIALERACQTQLLVEAALLPGTVGGNEGKLCKMTVSDEVAAYTKAGTGTPEVMYMQFDPEYRLILKETGGDFLE
jgi:ribulose-5-phosphate 4-epimerase/fuculose-1-phosphate aldolase